MGLALREVRRERKLTQTEVAYCFGLTVEGYRLYERGATALRSDTLARLAECLGVTVEHLAARLGFGGGEPVVPLPVDLEQVIARLTGSRRAGVALAASTTRWRELAETSRNMILATIEDAIDRAERDVAPPRRQG